MVTLNEGTFANIDYDYGDLIRSEFDSVETGEDPPDASAAFTGSLPKEITITVSLGYDKSFIEHTSNKPQINYLSKNLNFISFKK